MRFPYYQRLSAPHRRIYDASDAIRAVALPDALALRPLTVALEEALAAGKRPGVLRAGRALCAALFGQLGVPAPRLRVREVRPQTRGGELHGLYTFATEGTEPVIEVWMRTAAQGNVVRFRTFLRTLLHEVGHHLDVTLLGLEESFHTEGFFRRESSLVRQLLGERAPRPEAPAPPPRPVQLGLFGDG